MKKELKPNFTDLVASIVKVGASNIPPYNSPYGQIAYGSIIGEILSNLIPNQRIDRIAKLVSELDNKISNLEEDKIKKFKDPEAVDLFEEGAFQSARALGDDRIIYISKIVIYGMSGEAIQRMEAKRILSILKELDDGHIIMLSSLLTKNMRNTEFRERHKKVLHGEIVSIKDATEETRNFNAINVFGWQKLISLGLIDVKYRDSSRYQIATHSRRQNNINISGYNLSAIGMLLLQRIGLANSGEL